MPDETTMFAERRTRSSLTLQRNRYQGFQPMGGVRARPLRSAVAAGTQTRPPISTARAAAAGNVRVVVRAPRRRSGSRGMRIEAMGVRRGVFDGTPGSEPEDRF